MDKKKIARKIAEESIVLLKNADHILPLKEKKEITFFGRTQIGTLYSGNGSGGANIAGCGTILEECEKRGIKPESLLKEFYEYKASAEQVTEEDEFDWTKVSEMVNSGIMYEIFGKYKAPLDEYDVPETLIFQAAEKTDTAIFVIGRNSGGEECDRHLPEDYYLTRSEESLLKDICTHFANVVIVLNVNGLIDLSWMKKYASIKSLLFIGIPGEEGASALAGILTGEINPSGKLAVTIAEHYEDYPSADHFSWDKEHLENILDYESYGLSSEENGSTGFTKSPVTVYWEDIYTGYRYFDTFGKQVLYPFGYGLSYTAFAISDALVKKQNGGILVTADVKNIGEMSGKEVIQIYLSKVYPAEGVERPYQELKGFEKTSDLAPGEKEQVKIWIPWRELAVYDEERAAWVIESGDYLLKMGNSSRDTFVEGLICVEKTILAEQCTNCLNITECNNGKIEFLTQKENDAEMASVLNITEQNKDVSGQNIIFVTPEDVHDVQENRKCGKETISKAETTVSEREKERNLAELSIKELAALCVGYGPGTPFAAVGDRSDPSTIFDDEGKPMTTNSHPTGYPGYVSPAIEEKGIKSVFYKDGPAGIGGVAWPTEMLIACSFDKKLWQMFGDAVGKECEEQQVNVWLAPAVNLHRNPLCGRNFEYFSEDPYLTGVCACEITKGVQNSRPVIVCPKHFAANEQETFRRGNAGKNVDAVDSILTERALREQYLKPFEMLVKDAGIACIMTSFNKINGSFSGGSHDLCTHILREEWGFEGAVVTDWGDMDMVVDGADAVAAGNDIVMPGGPPVIRQILKGYEEGRVTREELEQAVRHLLIMIKRIRLAD
ncbi:glycoside hydrolase family 3 protein [Roseburia intestinalis]|uniref:Beta-glucosidase n=1 Tax=Roseburia intestinalis TaxID=166486 RepID=A0A3R6B4D4_9FIRM|nr:glycoside hydrolase family 3 protein [Roseburia intestinalis]RHC13737.1 beta-glucosidase [Roseburia intestinalis]